MQSSNFLRRTAALVLVTFTSLTMQPLQAAMQSPKIARAKPATATPDEKFSRALADIHEILKQLAPAAAMPVALTGKQKDVRAIGPNMKIVVEEDIKPMPGVNVAAKMKELRPKLKEVGDYSKVAEESFAEVEKHIKDKKLPAEILARHAAAVKEYQARKTEFEKLSQAVISADDSADKKTLPSALSALGTFFAKYPNEKTHTPTDPNKLPWRTPDGKVRKPFETEKEFKTSLFKQERTHLAGPIPWGLRLPATNLPATPVAGDLAQTEDVQITPAIQALADSLGKNPVKIYNWVRNNIEFLPTYGSIQGADMTLQTKRGNAFDTASLLIGLFRASGIPARYVYGTIEVPAEKAMNWVGGVTKPEAAQSLLGQGGIPNIGVIAGGTMRSIKLEHVWVEAWVDYVPSRGAVNKVGDTWVKMDASFKQYAYTQGIDIKTAVPLDTAQLLSIASQGATIDNVNKKYQGIDRAGINAFLSDYMQRVNTYVAQYPNASIEDMVGKKTIQAQNYSILLGSLPYKIIATGQQLNVLPSSLRMSITVKFFANRTDAMFDSPAATYETSLAKLGSRRLGTTFVPASAADAATLNSAVSSDSVRELPAYLINVKPEIRIDDQKVAEGSPATLGTDQVWEVTLVAPWRDSPSSHQFKTTAGSELVFGVSGAGVTESVVKSRFNSVASSASSENLHQMALHYWFEQDLLARLQAKERGIGYQLLSQFGLFSSPITVTSTFFGINKTAAYKGREMDVAHLLFAAATQDQKQRYDFASIIGTQGSHLEGAVPEQLFGRPYGQGVSAVRLLYEANEQGIPIYAIDQQNAAAIVPTLQIRSDTRSDIENAIAAGKMVIISESAPAHLNYQGIGYIVKDPIDGTGAYLIDGGLNGSALPDCTCEKVKVPKAQALKYLLITLLILAIIAGLIYGSGGIGAAGVPAAIKALLAAFGIPALFFPLNAQASTQTPPGCCITSECGKPDLFRGGRGADANLQKVRINWTNQRTGDLIDEIGYLDPTPLTIPPNTTCDTIDTVAPGLSESLIIIGGSGGASHDEILGNVSTPAWKLPADTFPPAGLCLTHDGVGTPTHWLLMPRSDMTFKSFCDLLRGFNPSYTKQ